jgi:hypothetical protein
MTRLPTPGGDRNNWGTILNDFLSTEHNADGSLKAGGSLAGKLDVAHGGREKLSVLANAGVAPIIDLSAGNVHVITLTASNTTISFTGATAGVACSISLYVRQDATGGRVITWPASVKWPMGIAPTLSTGANKIDLIALETIDGGTTWFGALAGADYR